MKSFEKAAKFATATAVLAIGLAVSPQQASALALGCNCWGPTTPSMNLTMTVGGQPPVITGVTYPTFGVNPEIQLQVTASASFVARDRMVQGRWTKSRIVIHAQKGLYMRGYQVIAEKSLVGLSIDSAKINTITLKLTNAQLAKVKRLQRLRGIDGVWAEATVVGPNSPTPIANSKSDPTTGWAGGRFAIG